MFGDWAKKPKRKAHFYDRNETVGLCLRGSWPDIDRFNDVENWSNPIRDKDKCEICMDSIKYALRSLVFQVYPDSKKRHGIFSEFIKSMEGTEVDMP